jgi:riboflavin synthase
MGHVDHVGKVMELVQQGKFLQVIIGEILPETRRYLIHKGSITLNGVSLTINAVHEKSFEVMLIPETLARTNLAYLKKDDTLNIEYDILAKMVAQNAGNFSYEHFVKTKNV